MSENEVRLAKRLAGGYDVYGEVDIVAHWLEQERDPSKGGCRFPRIEFSTSRMCPEWIAKWEVAVRFGISYVWERTPVETWRRVDYLQVEHISGHIVVTTSVVIAYVAALSAMKALGVPHEEDLHIDEAMIRFCFRR